MNHQPCEIPPDFFTRFGAPRNDLLGLPSCRELAAEKPDVEAEFLAGSRQNRMSAKHRKEMKGLLCGQS
jgi:hypothetical protein